jgi:hypothetical protein
MRMSPTVIAGQGHPRKLSKKDIKRVLILYLSGMSMRQLAAVYNVSRMAIWRVLR